MDRFLGNEKSTPRARTKEYIVEAAKAICEKSHVPFGPKAVQMCRLDFCCILAQKFYGRQSNLCV